MPTKYILYLTITFKLWDVTCQCFRKYWPRNKRHNYITLLKYWQTLFYIFMPICRTMDYKCIFHMSIFSDHRLAKSGLFKYLLKHFPLSPVIFSICSFHSLFRPINLIWHVNDVINFYVSTLVENSIFFSILNWIWFIFIRLPAWSVYTLQKNIINHWSYGEMSSFI